VYYNEPDTVLTYLAFNYTIDFPCPASDLWLTDHFVGKLSIVGQPTTPTQPSLYPRSVNMY